MKFPILIEEAKQRIRGINWQDQKEAHEIKIMTGILAGPKSLFDKEYRDMKAKRSYAEIIRDLEETVDSLFDAVFFLRAVAAVLDKRSAT